MLENCPALEDDEVQVKLDVDELSITRLVALFQAINNHNPDKSANRNCRWNTDLIANNFHRSSHVIYSVFWDAVRQICCSSTGPIQHTDHTNSANDGLG